MNKKQIISIGLIAIFIFLMLKGMSNIFNDIFIGVNATVLLESKPIITSIHIAIGFLVGLASIPFLRKIVTKEEARPGHIFLFFGLALFVSIIELVVTSLSAFSLLSLPKVTYAIHQPSKQISSMIVTPLVAFIYLLTLVFKKE